ncbi:MAG: oligoendopeptidase F, partial [bacterium]
MPPAVVPPRSGIALEHTWNAESVFPSPDAWEAAFQQVAGELPALRRFQGHLGDGPAALAEWFTEVQRVLRTLGHVVVYAALG